MPSLLLALYCQEGLEARPGCEEIRNNGMPSAAHCSLTFLEHTEVLYKNTRAVGLNSASQAKASPDWPAHKKKKKTCPFLTASGRVIGRGLLLSTVPDLLLRDCQQWNKGRSSSGPWASGRENEGSTPGASITPFQPEGKHLQLSHFIFQGEHTF